jgi:hypothetical protein
METAVREKIKNNGKLEGFLRGLDEETLTIALMVLCTKRFHRKVCSYEKKGDLESAKFYRKAAENSRKISQVVAYIRGIPFKEIEKGIYDVETHM